MIKNSLKISQFKFHILINVWCWFNLSKSGYSARILGVYSILARSHFHFNEQIMRHLAENGHQITMISPFPLSRPHQNMTVIDTQAGRQMDVIQIASATSLDNSWFTNFVNAIINWQEPECRHVMALEEVKNLKNNYDIIFLEVLRMYKCFLPLAKKLDIPVIGTLAHRTIYYLDRSTGNSRNPAVHPKEYTFLSKEMSFSERIFNLLEEISFQVIYFIENSRLETFFEELTGYPKQNLDDTCISLIFTNNHDIFVPRPMTQKEVHIGGMELKSKRLNPLPKDLERFINEAKHGVILFSFGTLFNSDTLQSDIISAIKIAFAKIPQRIIWKWDRNIEGISDNVLLTKWVPQKEVLAHKNVLAFISHSGLNSLYESIYYGKPLILMPLFTDQRGNAGILCSLGVSIHVNLRTIQPMELVDAVKEIIDNPKYLKNMKELSKRFKDDPMTPAQKVIYWTEYVLRHKGAQHLRWVGADIPSYQYFLIDIIGFVVVAFIFAIFLLYFLVKCISILFRLIYFRKFKLK